MSLYGENKGIDRYRVKTHVRTQEEDNHLHVKASGETNPSIL
jgi:hypothetical protein